MTLPTFDVKTLVENGVHFGHQLRRRNPKMNPYIFATKNKISIIDVRKTAPMLQNALTFLEKTAASGGQILFVGTKNQATAKVREMAEKTGQFYVNHRWLGGMLTNFKTVSKSIKRLEKIEKELEEADKLGYTKKEKLNMERDRVKLEMTLGGIRKMHRPAAVVIVDVVREKIALAEANTLGIPVVAICDTNCSPEGVDYIIPGNDDSSKAISLYADLFSGAVLSGLEKLVSAVDKKSVAKELTKDTPAKKEAKTEKPAEVKEEKKAAPKKAAAKKAEETTEPKETPKEEK